MIKLLMFNLEARFMEWLRKPQYDYLENYMERLWYMGDGIHFIRHNSIRVDNSL